MTKRTGSARPVVKNSTQSNQRNHRRNSGRDEVWRKRYG